MPIRNRFSRFLLALTVLIAFCAGMFSPRPKGVEAKPLLASLRDVIISEVAWGGTAANSADEWIELYNTTGSAINLAGWTLSTADLSPNLTFTGIIPAYGYFLIECTDNNTVSNLIADQVILGSCATNLSNSGELLTLKDNLAIVIDTANISGGDWDAGSGSPNYYSMERIGTTADSSSAWISNNGVIRNGLDAVGNPVNGTPHNSRIDLSLSMKLESASGGVPPYSIAFSVTVKNEGYGTATGVQVTDTLPVGLNYVSYTSTSGTYDQGTGIWNIGILAAGSSQILTITATMTALGILQNSAEIFTSGQLDPDSTPGNGIITEDDYDSIKIGSPVLGITNIVNNLSPNIGANVVFTITISNPNGNETGVAVDALLPVGLSYISHSSSVGTTYSNSTGKWTINDLASGASATLNITAQVLSPSVMSLIADVSSASFGNNSAIATVTPIPSTQANLKLEQNWVRSTSVADTAIITLTVTNQDAANAATNVQVRDLLPTGLTYVSHTSGLNYNSTTGIWAVGTILSGTNVTLAITVKVSPSGTSTTNFAEVWLSDQFDIDSTPGNGDVGEDDGESEEVLVSDLSLTQTSDISGTNAVFTIRVTNNGPDDATNVKVKNSKLGNLSASYNYVSNFASAGAYDLVSGDWTIGNLANGAIATLIVTTTVLVPDENLAEILDVREVDPDSLPNNNSRTEDDDAASPSADLSLTQVIFSPATYLNSDLNTNLTFRITVSNAGYANATGVEVKDLLPSGLTYVSHTSGQTYSSSSGIWSVGSLNSGQSRSLDITAKVTTLGIRTNWAEVWKSTQSDPDSNPGDGSTIDDDDASQTVTSYRTVIFNEIAWSGTTASAEDEWIELYNPSDTEITVTGWQIKKNSCAGAVYITLSGKVSKDGYFLLERGDTSTDNTTVSDVSANQIYLASSIPALSNSGETLYLCDNFGNFIDTANVSGGSWPAGSDSSSRPSMERQSTSTESDSSWVTNNGSTKNGLTASGGVIYGTPGKKNSVSSSSSTSATATPEPTDTPTLAPIPIPIDPRPIINEILARPGFDWNQDGRADVFDEFIEIKNLTAIDISLSGWTLDKVVPAGEPAESFSLPAVTLKPGERVVFYSKQTNLLLSDGGETVRLINTANGKIYDAFTYDIARAEDQSFCRLPDGNPGDSWFEDCLPTPNLTNTREGNAPASPDGAASPFCNLPDTIPLDFFIPECNGYGADIWNPFYWDFANWMDKLWIRQTGEKWRTFIE